MFVACCALPSSGTSCPAAVGSRTCALALQRHSNGAVRSVAYTCQRESTRRVYRRSLNRRRGRGRAIPTRRALKQNGQFRSRGGGSAVHSRTAASHFKQYHLFACAAPAVRTTCRGGHYFTACWPPVVPVGAKPEVPVRKGGNDCARAARCGDGSYEDTRDGEVGAAGRGALDGRLGHTSYIHHIIRCTTYDGRHGQRANRLMLRKRARRNGEGIDSLGNVPSTSMHVQRVIGARRQR